jgi:hypothetical protein
MRTVRPLPTKYKEHLFRSKLEAKAAAWLGSHGWHWIYEPDTLVYRGVRYTPDFYLPEIDTLVEVKPVIAIDEFARVEKLIQELQKPCVILSADDNGEIVMLKLWNYTGPCGNATGLPNDWAWHFKGEFDLFDFAGQLWIAGNICCTKPYGTNDRECSCHR